jgi:hypothetical protein
METSQLCEAIISGKIAAISRDASEVRKTAEFLMYGPELF